MVRLRFLRAKVSEAAVKTAGVPVPKGGTVLLCTGHHERTFPHKEYSSDNSGVNVAATEWLAQQGVAHRFTATRCADESPPKPHPGMLRHLMDEVGADVWRWQSHNPDGY